MKTITINLFFFFTLFFLTGNILAAQLLKDPIKVKAKKKYYHSDGTRSYSEWCEFDTRTLYSLDTAVLPKEPAKNIYGGRLDKSTTATGFFYVKQVNGRWWLIDPVGNYYINKGIVSLRPNSSLGEHSKSSWLEESEKLLLSNGFNGVGNWSFADLLKEHNSKLAYTRGFTFMQGYGKQRGGTFQQPGHIGYPNDAIFVFDPGFELYCDSIAKQAILYKDEQNLIGYFSDNEMPFPQDALDKYLGLAKSDYGYLAAVDWLNKRKDGKWSLAQISEKDRNDFLFFMADKYFSIVSKALKKNDPNHLYLGCRFHGSTIKQSPVFKAAGKYLDIISVNYYDVWTPEPDVLKKWTEWSGRPVVITEWYTKADDSGMKNESGAGWIVQTQRDRGYFYQNFTIALLESKTCVGWHWFKYQDNDPNDKTSDPSNVDANKGIVNNAFVPYLPLLEEMNALNQHVYGIADYFDIH